MKRFLAAGLTLLFLGLVTLVSQSGLAPPAERPAEKSWRAFGGIQPQISPDGTQIAFSWNGAIWRIPRTGGTATRLTDGDNFDIEPAWSPDGKQIAFVNSPQTGAGDLVLIDAATGKSIPLTNKIQPRTTAVFNKLYFHPEGGRVLGAYRLDGKDLGLAWYDLKSGQTTTVAAAPRWMRYALSHDGMSIIYATALDVDGQQMGNDGPQADLWKISAAGGAPEKITRFPDRIHDLCFAADDSGLYVETSVGGVHHDVWQIRLNDPLRSAQKLTMGQADEGRPSVSRDGRWLVYTDNREGPTAFVVRDLTTGNDQTISVNRTDFGKPTGTLRLRTVDKTDRQPVITRVSIEEEKGKFYAPVGALFRILNDYGHFYCDKECELTLPAGKYRLRAFRGTEYRVTHQTFEVVAGKPLDLAVELERWTNQPARQWYSGENHIHANYGYGEWYNTPASMFQQCNGEDLHVCNFMVGNSETDGVYDREFFRGGPDPLSTGETILYWNQEFRSTIWGHMTLVNLRQIVEPVFTGFKDTTNPWDIPTNSDIADRTHLQQGLVNYTHPAFNPADLYDGAYAGKSVPMDVALGKIDTMDLNLAYQGAVPLWHRLLNCGFRVPASAGTDTFLNRMLSRVPGGDRVFVKVPGPLTYAGWIDGLKAGRSFVTNGPMLELTIEQKEIGDTIRIDAPRELRVTAKATAQFPLEKVELIYNGKVVASGKLSEDKLQAVIEQGVKTDRSGWFSLRAIGPGHPDHVQPTLEAHTSPIYVKVKGAPTSSREDAEYFVKWIDRLALAIRVRDRIPSEKLKQHVESQLEAARAVYLKVAEAAP